MKDATMTCMKKYFSCITKLTDEKFDRRFGIMWMQ